MNADVSQVMMRMIAQFGQLGIVEVRPGVKNDPDLPAYLYVETLVAGQMKDAAAHATVLLAGLRRPLNKLEKAGWASHEQLEAFRAVRVQKR